MLARFRKHIQEQLYGDNTSKTVKTEVRAGYGRFGADGSGGILGFFSTSTGPSDLVVKIATEMDELEKEIIKTLNEGDHHRFLLNFSLLEKQMKLQRIIESDNFKTRVNAWSELGVHYLQDDNEPKAENCVCILIAKDANNLPLKLQFSLETQCCKPSFWIDLSGSDKERERIIKYNLTYLRDVQSASDEASLLSNKLHYSSNQARISLMNAYNAKWEGQLAVTYLIDHVDHDTTRGTAAFSDASGVVFYKAYSNEINMDGIPPRPQFTALPQGSDQPARPVFHNVVNLSDKAELPFWPGMISAGGTALLAYTVIFNLTKNATAALICAEVGGAAGLYFTDRYYRNQAQNEERNNQAQRLTL